MKIRFQPQDDYDRAFIFVLLIFYPDMETEESIETALIDNGEEVKGRDAIFKHLTKKDTRFKNEVGREVVKGKKEPDPVIRAFKIMCDNLRAFLVNGYVNRIELLTGLSRFNCVYQLFYALDLRPGMIVALNEKDPSKKIYTGKVKFTSYGVLDVSLALSGSFKKKDLLNKSFLFMVNIQEAIVGGYKTDCAIVCVNDGNDEKPLIVCNDYEGGSCELEDKPCIIRGITIGKVDLDDGIYFEIINKLKLKNNNLVYDDIPVIFRKKAISFSTMKNGSIDIQK